MKYPREWETKTPTEVSAFESIFGRTVDNSASAHKDTPQCPPMSTPTPTPPLPWPRGRPPASLTWPPAEIAQN